MERQFRITAVEAEGAYVGATGVVVNSDGAWLGEYQQVPTGPDSAAGIVVPLTDEDGEYIPAASNWPEFVVEELS
jgi:hypothetical protein